MKKAALVLGIISASIISIGALFKLQHWPGQNIFTLLGVFILIVAFLPVLYINCMLQKKRALIKVSQTVGLIAGWTLGAGCLFYILYVKKCFS